jgi:hypothetical protein
MGLTKEYVRYVPTNTFGVISANQSNIKLIDYKGNQVVACGACEYVFIWDLKKSEIVSFYFNY